MDMRLSVARGMVRLEDLEPGSLFIHNGTLAVKSNGRSSAGECKCVIIGTGAPFFANTTNAEELNNLWVQPAALSEYKN